MSHVSIVLTGLMLMAMLVFIAPSIFAINRGHILRNVALWLAIFLGLALFYKSFGPESPHPLFKLPDAMAPAHKQEDNVPASPSSTKEDDTNDVDTGTNGFTPPKE